MARIKKNNVEDKISIDILKNLSIGDFWDEFYEKYKLKTLFNEHQIMNIPIEDILPCIECELDREMWYCSKVTAIRIIRYDCGNLGDIFKVRTMSNEDILIEYSYKSISIISIPYDKYRLPLIKMFNILTNIYYNIRFSYVNFLCETRYSFGKNLGHGYNVDLFNSEFIDIKKFIERNSEKYGIFYRYEEKSPSILSHFKDEEDKEDVSDVTYNMIVYFIKDEWV